MPSRTIVPILLMACLLTCGAGPPPVDPMAPVRAAINPKVAELVGMVGAGRLDAMLDRIGPPPEAERPSLEATRDKLIAIYNDSGKYSGFDIAGYKVLTPRYVVAYALVYFDKRPVLFEIGFYQVDGQWRPQKFFLEKDFKELLDTMPLQK